MTAFEISVNGKKVCTAGLNEVGVVSSVVTWVRGAPKNEGTSPVERVDLRVAGLNSRTETHLTWLTRSLQVGDEVKIKVLAKTKADKPASRKSNSEMKELAAKFKARFQKQLMSNQSKDPTPATVTPVARQPPRQS
jgi:alpha-galactosidase/6-phospho-beta-glucosidase family protein